MAAWGNPMSNLLSGLEISQADGPIGVLAAGCREHRLFLISDAGPPGSVAGQDNLVLACTQIPKAQRPVEAGRQSLARRTEADAEYARGVPGHLAKFLAGRRVPQAHGPVVAARKDTLAIRRQ